MSQDKHFIIPDSWYDTQATSGVQADDDDDDDSLIDVDVKSELTSRPRKGRSNQPPAMIIFNSDYGVKDIVGHKYVSSGRKFKLLWSDGKTSWEPEENCQYCHKLVSIYCKDARIEMTNLNLPAGGFIGIGTLVEGNLTTMEQIIDKIQKYGNKNSIQPQIYDGKFPEHDALIIDQIGLHFFVILYQDDLKLALLSDPANCFKQSELVQCLMARQLPCDIKLEIIDYASLGFANQGGAAAVCIGIEFQRAYMNKSIPSIIKPARSCLQRVGFILHKRKEPSLRPFVPISQRSKGVTCDKCGRNWRNHKSRNFLHLHKCQ